MEDKFHRSIAGSGGTGGIKSVTNYAPVSMAIAIVIYYIHHRLMIFFLSKLNIIYFSLL